MQPLRKMLMFVLIGFSVVLFVWNVRRGDPARYVQNISYPVGCLHCGKKSSMTIAEMNAMVRRGEVVSPAGQMRRFKCASCGETNVILDAGGRHEPAVN